MYRSITTFIRQDVVTSGSGHFDLDFFHRTLSSSYDHFRVKDYQYLELGVGFGL